MCFSNFFKRALLAGLVAGLVAACGGGGSSPAPTPTPTPTAANVLAVTVDLGPNGNSANSLFTTVKVCQPGSTTNCQTIDHVLVDTGSTGLRLLSSQLPSSLNLPLAGSAGAPVLNCVKFVDGSFMWGPVASADVVLSGKTASNVPIQLIGDPAYDSLSATCQTGKPMNTIASLGAKGVLGVGLFLQDCVSSSCTTNAGNGYYFTCTGTTCAGSIVSTAKQLQNPVALFASDNNGLLIDLPAVTSSTTTLAGSIIFGVATQTNNQLSTGGRVLKTDGYGNIGTVFQGVNTNNSYIDSGSNALFFNSNTIPSCTNANYTWAYCPNGLTLLTAVMSVTAPTAVSVTVPFYVDNAAGNSVFGGSALWSVYPTLAGPGGPASGGFAAAFDWGLPFFYGKRVFIGFEGQTSALGSGTYFAF